MSKVWLVTGCSRGLGRILAGEVLARGDKLVAASLRPEQIDALRYDYGAQVFPVSLDDKNPCQACDAVRAALDAFGRLDVLVNTPGRGMVASIDESTVEMFREQFEANLAGVINMTRAALPLMRVQRSGIIMQVSSLCGRIGCPGLGAFQAAQWGIEGFSEALSREAAPFGVKVVIVEPAVVPGVAAGSSPIETIAVTPAPGGAFFETIRMYEETMDGKSDDRCGDDLRAVARTMIMAADEAEPPLRLPVGSGAYQLALEKDADRLAETKKWKGLSVSADSPAPLKSSLFTAHGSASR